MWNLFNVLFILFYPPPPPPPPHSAICNEVPTSWKQLNLLQLKLVWWCIFISQSAVLKPCSCFLYLFPHSNIHWKGTLCCSVTCTCPLSCGFLIAAAVYIQMRCQQGPGQFCRVSCLLPRVSQQPFLSLVSSPSSSTSLFSSSTYQVYNLKQNKA